MTTIVARRRRSGTAMGMIPRCRSRCMPRQRPRGRRRRMPRRMSRRRAGCRMAMAGSRLRRRRLGPTSRRGLVGVAKRLLRSRLRIITRPRLLGRVVTNSSSLRGRVVTNSSSLRGRVATTSSSLRGRVVITQPRLRRRPGLASRTRRGPVRQRRLWMAANTSCPRCRRGTSTRTKGTTNGCR